MPISKQNKPAKETKRASSPRGVELADERWRNQLSDLSAITDVSLSPQLTPDSALKLQPLIGNRAIVRLLEAQSSSNDAIIQAKEHRAGYRLSEKAIQVILGKVSSTTPPIAPYEVISATTAAQFSTGELEAEIERLWKRERLSFTHAARIAARKNTSDERDGGAVATQSPEFTPSQPYSKRWNLGLFAYDYQKWGDLPAIKRLLRKGSPFQESLGAEFNNVINHRNPTGIQMNTAILETVASLSDTLAENEIDELVVFFSGHGGAGSIYGVDEKGLEPNDLERQAKLAEEFGVHLVFVLDTCRGGYLTSFAQAHASRRLGEDIENLPETKKEPVQQSHVMVRKLVKESVDMKVATLHALDTARVYWKKRSRDNDSTRVDAMLALNESVGKFIDTLEEDIFVEDKVPNLATLDKFARRIRLDIIWAATDRRHRTMEALDQMATLLDTLNDSLNIMLLNLQEQIKSSRSQVP